MSEKIALDDVADLSTLPNRMWWAATVLDEVSVRAGSKEPCAYHADQLHLREWARRWEAEDRKAAERDALVEELARLLLFSVTTLPHGRCREIAHKLIESGWRKAEAEGES